MACLGVLRWDVWPSTFIWIYIVPFLTSIFLLGFFRFGVGGEGCFLVLFCCVWFFLSAAEVCRERAAWGSCCNSSHCKTQPSLHPSSPFLSCSSSGEAVSLHSLTPSYLLQVWVLDCNQILSPVKGGGEILLWAGAVVLGDLFAQ